MPCLPQEVPDDNSLVEAVDQADNLEWTPIPLEFG